MKTKTKKEPKKDLMDKYDELIVCLKRAEELAEELTSECISEKIKSAHQQTIEELYWLVNVVYGKDKKKDEVVFNIYAKIDEENIIKMEPMPPSEMPEQDMRIEIDFDKVYDLIYSSEKEMQGERIESPPWSRKSQPVQKIKEAVNGIKMWFKVKSMLNSADYSPSESKSDAKTLLNEFMSKMMEGGDDRGKGKDRDMKEEKDNQDGKNLWDSKEKITGEVVGN